MPFKPTDANLAQMHLLWDQNRTVEQIADYFDCTQMTVRNWIARFEVEDPENPAHDLRRDNSGRHFKITNEELLRVRESLEENPFQPVKHMPANLGIDVTEKTLRTSVKKLLNIKHRKAARKAMIKDADVATRIAYANQHRFRSKAEWKRTVAVDEKVFATCKDGICFIFKYTQYITD